MDNFRDLRRQLLKAAGIASGAALLPGGWASAAQTRLDVLTFPGAYNLLIWAAQERGYFATEGLEVGRKPTTTSMYLINSVNSAAYPVGSSSLDNVVAYNEGQGQVALDRPAELFAFVNIQKNMTFPLVVTAEIATVADLRGKSLAVDAVSTGFSFVLREILKVYGLGPGDYELASVGNARDRLTALEQGSHAGAILTPPFDRMAADAGLRIIATSRDAFEQYQGTTFITSRYWANNHGEELVAYCKAILRSLDWVRNPASADAAASLLAARMPGMAENSAAQAVADLRCRLDPEFNTAGMKTVLELRSRYGRPKTQLTNPDAYIDRQYLAAARAALAK